MSTPALNEPNRFPAEALLYLGRIRLEMGDPDGARSSLDEALSQLTERKAPEHRRHHTRVLLELARLERLAGSSPERAWELQEEANRILESLDAPDLEAGVACERGHLLLTEGRSASQELLEARRLGATIPPRLRQDFEATLEHLECAQMAFDEGEVERCVGGELLESIPTGLRRWLSHSGRVTADRFAEPPDPLPFDTIGPWRITAVIGSGGGGVVCRASHQETGAEAALKTVARVERRRMQQIRREVHALARLRHPGIVRVLEEAIDSDPPWYAMEMVEGIPLDLYGHMLHEGTSGGSSVSHRTIASLLTVLHRLCSALAHLHGEGLVHRDLKPRNVLVRLDGRPILVDLGLVSRVSGLTSREEIEAAGVSGGSVMYTAPEQLRGELVDARADLYALGVVLYELLTGQPPFQGASAVAVIGQHLTAEPVAPSKLIAGIPPGLDELTLRLLAKDPNDRYGYAADVARVLERLGADVEKEPAPAPRGYLYQPRLAGRTGPFAQLRRRLEALHGGGGSFLWIGGESGVGKTRLALEAVRTASNRGFLVLTGSSEESIGEPLHSFRRVLQGAIDRCREGGPEMIERVIGRRGPTIAPYAPDVLRLPGQKDQPPPVELPGRAARLRLFSYLTDMFAALADHSPTLLVLDDLHWADDLSLDLLEHLIQTRRFEATHLLILGTYRREETPPRLLTLIQSPATTWLDLENLEADEVASMVSDMLAIRPAPEILSAFLARESRGNPFFVAEYLRAAVEEKLLSRDPDGHWYVEVPGEGDATIEDYERLPLPARLLDLVRRRLDTLPEPARRILSVAAVLEREADPEMLRGLARLEMAPFLEGLSELLFRRVVEETDPGDLRFVHAQLRRVAYDSIAAEDRAELHRRIATSIEKRPDGEGGDALAALAHHWNLGGQPLKARSYYHAAALEARDRYAYEESVRLFRECLALTPSPSESSVTARGELASILSDNGKPIEAEQEYQRALEDARKMGRREREGIILRALGSIRQERGEMEAAGKLYEEALAIHRADGHTLEEARALRHLANLASNLGRAEEAERLYEQTLAVERREGDRHGQSLTLSNMAILLYEQARFEESCDLLRESLQLKRELGDRRGESTTLGNLAALYLRTGRVEEARAAFEETLAIKREVGDRRGEAMTLGNLANIYFEQGDHERAGPMFEETLAVHRALGGSRRNEGIMLSNVGGLLRAQGKLERALATFRECLDIHREVGNRRSEGITLSQIAGVLHEMGEIEEAQSLYVEALEIHQEIGDRRDEGSTLAALGDLERQTAPDLSQAHEMARQAEVLLRATGDRQELARALIKQAHLRLAEGMDCDDLVREADAIARDLGASRRSMLGRDLVRLRRDQKRQARGEDSLLHRGQSLEDLPEGLRRHLVDSGLIRPNEGA